MRGSALHASSGFESYDHAEFEEWVPSLGHVVSRPEGLSTLSQSVSRDLTGRNLARVPPIASACLLLWRWGAPNVECKLAGRTHRLVVRPGTGFLIPPGADSEWVSDVSTAHGVMHLHFAPELLQRTGQGLGVDALGRLGRDGTFDSPEVSATATWLFTQIGERAPESLLWDTAATMLTVQLLRRERAVGDRPASGGLAPWQERRATEHLRAHLNADIGLDDLAGLVNLSTFHFARMFKQSTGLPPHAYLRRLRCEEARRLLETTDLPVTEIALSVGYDSSQALARMFGREVGVSPSEYRRERRT